jgi:hypothetical protein
MKTGLLFSILAICLIPYYKLTTIISSILDSTLQFHEDTHLAPVTTTSTTSAIPKPLKILHVVNFYSSVQNNNNNNNNNNNESSLDQTQSITIESIIRAREMAFSHLNIRLVGAVFPEDAHVVPDDFEIRHLNRSTLSEYSNATLTKKLPFLQDLIKGVVTDEDKDDFDYFVYANSDIVLDHSFYNHVAEIIGRGYDAFSINRHDLPKKYYQSALEQSTLNLEQLYSIHTMGRRHPGKDCFVISKAVWQKLYLGNVFIGHPPWGAVMSRILKQVASNYHAFDSHENVTFHLGSERAWNKNKNKIRLTEAQHRLIHSCPIRELKASSSLLENMINCAALFEGENRKYKYA